MPLSSQSTDEEVQAAYDDNANYRANGSVDEAKLFVHACRILMRRTPTSAGEDGQMASFPVYLLEGQIRDADQFIALNARRGGGVKHADLRNCRE